MAVDATSRIDLEPDSLPEKRDGCALQRQDEPEYQTDDRCYADDGPQDEGVYSGDGETEQSEGDGDLGDRADPDVAGLA